MPTPTYLEERWRALLLAARAEFWRAGFDANHELYSVYELRLLRGRLTDRGEGSEWFTRLIADEELADGDLHAVARDFFSAWQAARARHPR